jgi:hypothetical protein
MKKNVKISITIVICIICCIFLSFQYVTETTALNNLEITLYDIKIQDLKLTYCTLKLSLYLNNPSEIHISDLSAEFDVFIAGNFVGTGTLPKSSIPPKLNSNKDVYLQIYYSDVATAVIDGIKNGNFDLSIDGVAKANVFFNLFPISKKIASTHSYP